MNILNRSYWFYVKKCMYFFLFAAQAHTVWSIGQEKIPTALKDWLIVGVLFIGCFLLGVYWLKCFFETE